LEIIIQLHTQMLQTQVIKTNKICHQFKTVQCYTQQVYFADNNHKFKQKRSL